MGEKRRWPREVWLDAMWDATTLTPNARVVAYAYARYAKSGDVTWCPYPELMRRTGITSRKAVSAAIKDLVAAGWLTTVEEAKGRRSTRFRLTRPPASSSDTELLAGEPDGRSSSDTELLAERSSSASTAEQFRYGTTRPRSSSDTELDGKKVIRDDKKESDLSSSSVTRARDDRRTTEIINILSEHTNAKPAEVDSPEWVAAFLERLSDLAAEPIRNHARYLAAMTEDGSLQDRLDEYRADLEWDALDETRNAFRHAMQNEPACEHGYPGGHIRDEHGWMTCPVKRNADDPFADDPFGR